MKHLSLLSFFGFYFSHSVDEVKKLFFLLLIAFFVWPSATLLHGQILETNIGPRYVVVDYKEALPASESVKLEYYVAFHNVWNVAGSFQKPTTLKEFMQRYYNLNASFPDLVFLPMDSAKLEAFWIGKSDAQFIGDLEPFKDRVLSASMGFSVILPAPLLAQADKLRASNRQGQLGEIAFDLKFDNVWPAIRFQDMNPFDRYASAAWWAHQMQHIQSFNVYRSVEYKNDFQLYSAAKSMGVHHDTMIFVLRDTLLSDPGIYQYYITLTDIAGNESGPSPVVRMPNMGGLNPPYVKSFRADNRKDMRGVDLYWNITQPERIRTIRILREDHITRELEFVAYAAAYDTTYTDIFEDVQRNYYYHLEVYDVVLPEPILTPPAFGRSERMDTAFANIRLFAEPTTDGVHFKFQVDHAMHLDGFYITRGQNFDPELQVISDLIPFNLQDSVYEYRDTDDALRGDAPYGYSILLVSDSYAVTPYRDTVFVYPGVPIRMPAPDIFMAGIDLDENARIAWQHDMYDEIPLRYYLVCPLHDNGTLNEALCDTISWENNFIDIQNVNPGDEFGVLAVHLTGSKSPFATTGPLQYPDVRIQGPEHLWQKPGSEHPVIAWVPVSDPRIKSLHLYRMLNDPGQGAQKIAILEKTQDEYTDLEISPSGSVLYQIVPLLYNGKNGIPSEILTIRYD